VKTKEFFPKTINKYNKTSEIIEKNSKKLNLYQAYNENNAMIELINAKYSKNLEIYRYKYKAPLYAYSEFTIAKDNSYEKFNKSEFAYQVTDKVVILSNEYIYIVSLPLCDLDKLRISPETTIKLPKNKIDSNLNYQKLFINEDNLFPFFKSYIKREAQYKGIILSTIEPLKKDDESISKLDVFIKKQAVVEETNKYVLFIIKENGSLFLWNKEKSILFLNFTENDLEKIKNI
jgi:hypothetical protein